jgi:hypothetical protein
MKPTKPLKKQRLIALSDVAWATAKTASERCSPAVTRPAWIENAIKNQAKKEGIKSHG